VPILLVGAVFLLAAMEFTLPVTPFKTTLLTALQGRSMRAAQVDAVRDGYYLSPEGNPVGIRVSYEVRFPRGGRLSSSPSLKAVDDRYRHYQTSMGRLASFTIDPPPEKIEAGEYLFADKESYLFTADFLPTFLAVERRSGLQTLCLWMGDTPTLSGDELLDLLQDPEESGYRVEVVLRGNSYFIPPLVAWSGETTRRYSLSTFYRSAVKEEFPPCPW
jgi:hypothetical protein